MKYFHIDPLARRIAVRMGKNPDRPFNDQSNFDQKTHLTIGELRREIGCSKRTAVRYLSGQLVSAKRADELAVSAGFHPAEVWEDW